MMSAAASASASASASAGSPSSVPAIVPPASASASASPAAAGSTAGKATAGRAATANAAMRLVLARYKPRSTGMLPEDMSKTIVDAFRALLEQNLLQTYLGNRLSEWRGAVEEEAEAESSRRSLENRRKHRRQKKNISTLESLPAMTTNTNNNSGVSTDISSSSDARVGSRRRHSRSPQPAATQARELEGSSESSSASSDSDNDGHDQDDDYTARTQSDSDFSAPSDLADLADPPAARTTRSRHSESVSSLRRKAVHWKSSAVVSRKDHKARLRTSSPEALAHSNHRRCLSSDSQTRREHDSFDDANVAKDAVLKRNFVAEALKRRMFGDHEDEIVDHIVEMCRGGREMRETVRNFVVFLLTRWGFKSRDATMYADHAFIRRYEEGVLHAMGLSGFGKKVFPVWEKVALTTGVTLFIALRDMVSILVDSFVHYGEVFIPRIPNPDYYARFGGALYEAQLVKWRTLKTSKKDQLVRFALAVYDELSNHPHSDMLDLNIAVPGGGVSRVCAALAKHYDKARQRYNEDKFLPGFDYSGSGSLETPPYTPSSSTTSLSNSDTQSGEKLNNRDRYLGSGESISKAFSSSMYGIRSSRTIQGVTAPSQRRTTAPITDVNYDDPLSNETSSSPAFGLANHRGGHADPQNFAQEVAAAELRPSLVRGSSLGSTLAPFWRRQRKFLLESTGSDSSDDELTFMRTSMDDGASSGMQWRAKHTSSQTKEQLAMLESRRPRDWNSFARQLAESGEHPLHLNICEPDLDSAMQLYKFFCSEPAVRVFNMPFDAVAESTEVVDGESVIDCFIVFGNSLGHPELTRTFASLRQFFGEKILTKIGKHVCEKYMGEQPIGSAFVIETGHEKVPLLCYAAAYHAQDVDACTFAPMWGALVAIHKYNSKTAQRLAKAVLSKSSPSEPAFLQRSSSLRTILRASPRKLIRVVCTAGLSRGLASRFESSRELFYAWRQSRWALEASNNTHDQMTPQTHRQVSFSGDLRWQRSQEREARFAACSVQQPELRSTVQLNQKSSKPYVPDSALLPLTSAEGKSGGPPSALEEFTHFLDMLRTDRIASRGFISLEETHLLLDVMLDAHIAEHFTDSLPKDSRGRSRALSIEHAGVDYAATIQSLSCAALDEELRLKAAQALARVAFPIEIQPGTRAAILQREGALEFMLESAVNGRIAVHDELDDPQLLRIVKRALSDRSTGEQTDIASDEAYEPMRIVECVHAEKCARVYRATIADSKLFGEQARFNVAIKVTDELFLNFDRPEFIRETAIMCMLRHHNIVECLGAYLPEKLGEPLLTVQEWLPCSLKTFLRTDASEQPVNLSLRLSIGVQVARGVSFLHSYKVVHRDLKSANIMILGEAPFKENLHIKLIDFGCSEVLAAPASGKREKDGEYYLQTAVPRSVGTGPYMGPELLGKNVEMVTDRVDSFAFAVVLWELLTRKTPWEDIPSIQVGDRVREGARLTIPQHAEQFEEELITNCWQTDPRRRPSMKEALQRLTEKAEGFHLYV